jgi:hypothetical protein
MEIILEEADSAREAYYAGGYWGRMPRKQALPSTWWGEGRKEGGEKVREREREV